MQQASRATDRPLTDTALDDFQRALFARRIADTLLTRASAESIVLGLYGKWGEGKSTVLNFIRHTLAGHANKVVVLNFNPWRFADETQLLLNFFGELARAIDRQLTTPGEKAAKALASYVTPLLPSVSLNLATLGSVSADFSKSLENLLGKAQPDADKLRTRLEQLLQAAGQRVVVIIDDIDRLEKTHIQAIFRLVKLTADFQHTAYLLAFDDELVARAIGELFAADTDGLPGQRSLLAGRHFLEKIIQVPLRLPRARTADLLNFCYRRVEEALGEAHLSLSVEALNRLREALRAGILPRLGTPRLAVRYANALTFSLPLVRDEVNAVDFLLTEALNVFYPELYQFVATHEGYLTGSIRHEGGYSSLSSREAKEETVVERALRYYEQADERAGAQALLSELFPRVSQQLSGYRGLFSSLGRLTEAELAQGQHLASADYFGRYFAYTVLREDVTDQEFAAFLRGPAATQFTTALGLQQRLGKAVFLQKIAYRIPEVDAAQTGQLWQLLSRLSHLGSTSGETYQAAKLLLELLAQLPVPDRYGRLLTTLQAELSFSLAQCLAEVLLPEREAALARYARDSAYGLDLLFTAPEWERLLPDLAAALLGRALREAGDKPLYLTHPEHVNQLFYAYWSLVPTLPPLQEYLKPFLEAIPLDVHTLLELSAPLVYSGNKEPFRGVISASIVETLEGAAGPLFYLTARRVLGAEVVPSYPGRRSEEPTADTRLRQFIYLSELQNAPQTDAGSAEDTANLA